MQRHPPPVSSLDKLLQEAEKLSADVPAVKKALERCRTTIANLQAAVEDATVKAEARAEIARLEAQLAAAKARLRSSGSPATARPTAEPQNIGSQSRQPAHHAGGLVPYFKINEWARNQGIEVRRERPPRELIDRYLAAHR